MCINSEELDLEEAHYHYVINDVVSLCKIHGYHKVFHDVLHHPDLKGQFTDVKEDKTK